MTNAINTSKAEISVGDFFCFCKGMAINSCFITEVREKAVKVDIATDGVWCPGNIIIYTKSAWIPKSVLEIDNKGMIQVKKWFANKGNIETYPIKKYYTEDNKKVYC